MSLVFSESDGLIGKKLAFYVPLVFYVSDDLVCWNVSPASEV